MNLRISRNSLALALLLSVSSFVQAASEWPRFRGPTGRGHADGKDIPVKWSPESVAWKATLKGTGQSSPVNVGNKLFVTSASPDGSERFVTCLDRDTGKQLWERAITCATPEKAHRMNSHATPSCATDGERIIAFFGPGGIHCYDLNGRKIWSKDLGSFPGSWGTAASPVIFNDKVIQNCDAVGASSLVALDTATGNELWKTKREDKPRGGWSTPIVIDAGKRKELILNGEFGVHGYDPESGKELWFCKSFNGRGSPVPEFANGLVYVVSGKPGDIYAVTPGGSGDVTKTRMKWHSQRRGGRDLPSPAIVGNYIFVLTMSGIGSCYDAKTGEMLWNDRIPMKGEFAGAPLVANGLVYFQAVNGGDTVVVKPGKTPEFVAQNSLGADSKEIFRAGLAPIGGRLFARSQSTVYCIKP